MAPVRAIAFNAQGQPFVRGFRTHCPDCGLLSEPLNYVTAARRLQRHRKRGCPAKEA